MKIIRLDKKIFYFVLVVSFICLALPALFAGVQFLAGIFSVLGLFLFLFLNRFSNSKKEILSVYIAFVVSFSIRFCRIFITTIPIFFIGLGALIILALFFDCLMFATLLISKSKIRYLTPVIFPLGYTLFFMIFAEIHFGNVFNLMNYFLLMNIFAFNLTWISEFGLTFALLFTYCLILEIPFIDKVKFKIINAFMGFAIVIALCISGACLTPNINSPDFTINVALAISEKRDFNGYPEKEMTKEDYFKMFKEQIQKAKSGNADLIVFQEEYAYFTLDEEESYLSYYSDILKEYNLPALIGASEENSDGKSKNKAYFFDGEGKLISSYQKVNVIPYIETLDYEGGKENSQMFTATINGHSINITTVICFDLNNDFFMRKINSKTELILAPSWDWDDGNEEQLRTYVRSIECDTTLIKHSYDGFSYVSTPNGIYGDIIDNRGQDAAINFVQAPIYKKS